jgi:hypothetical protein
MHIIRLTPVKTLLASLLFAASLAMPAYGDTEYRYYGTITQTVTATDDTADYYVGEIFTGWYSYQSPTADGTYAFDFNGAPFVSSNSLAVYAETLYPTVADSPDFVGYPGPVFGELDPNPFLTLTVVDDTATLDSGLDHIGLYQSIDGNVGNALLYDPGYDFPGDISVEDTTFSVVLSDPVAPDKSNTALLLIIGLAGIAIAGRSRPVIQLRRTR